MIYNNKRKNVQWGIFVPTYQRKSPLILEMLKKDSQIVLHLCVREEEILSGFYDEIQSLERVKIVNLGKNISDIGDTRQRILKYCTLNEIDYCFMIDDGITNISNLNDSMSITEACETIIKEMMCDEHHEHIACCGLRKRHTLNSVTGKWSNVLLEQDFNRYFGGMPNQLICINVNRCKETDITYHSLEQVGFEDASFFIDVIRSGSICIFLEDIVFDGITPNTVKSGGNGNSLDKIEKKYMKYCKKCLDYAGDMFGVTSAIKFRRYIGAYVEHIRFDYEYFREVLVERRQLNEPIIRSKFSRQKLTSILF